MPEAYFSAAYYEGESFGGIDVRELTGAKAWEVSEGGEALAVTLSAPLASGGKAQLSMKFEVMLPKMDFRLGIGEHTVNLSHFFPVLSEEPPAFSSVGDPFPAERADYTFSLTAPASYDIICGFEGETAESNGRKTLSVRAENVREVAFVLAEGMTCSKGEADGTPSNIGTSARMPPQSFLPPRAAFPILGSSSGNTSIPNTSSWRPTFPSAAANRRRSLSSLSSLRWRRPYSRRCARDGASVVVCDGGSDEVRSAWLDEGLANIARRSISGQRKGAIGNLSRRRKAGTAPSFPCANSFRTASIPRWIVRFPHFRAPTSTAASSTIRASSSSTASMKCWATS